MNTNPHGARHNPTVGAMGGGVAGRFGSVPNTNFHCRAILSPEHPRTAERRACLLHGRAAHHLFGSQGFVRAHHATDVAETAIFPTADKVAVSVRGVAMANRKHGPRGHPHA
jgi:hypothetical protein